VRAGRVAETPDVLTLRVIDLLIEVSDANRNTGIEDAAAVIANDGPDTLEIHVYI